MSPLEFNSRHPDDQTDLHTLTEYDIAISFAGEDRASAQQLADFLVNQFHLTVFYDDYEQATLWGTHLTEKLIRIYRDNARFCVVLVSVHYKIKRWTRHEWRAAQERAFTQSEKEYILPIHLDDTKLDGLFETMGFLDARKLSMQTIARLIFEKVGDFSKLSEVVRLADQKYREGLTNDALALISDSKFDGHIDALRVRALAFESQGKYVDAIRALDLILKERPRDFLAHFLLGIFCFRLGDFKRSVAHYEIAETLSPDHPTIQTDLPIARKHLSMQNPH
jgi:tetratricopeptide (TPR) repeat protein